MVFENASVDSSTMVADDQICHEFSHSFTDFSSSYIVGYKCDSIGLFIGISIAAIVLVVGQNVLATKEGQQSRMALTTRKGSKERGQIIWSLLWYTFLSSVLGTVHVLLVVGANVVVLSALMVGNLLGVWWSYHEQKADEHDPSGDLTAILRAARENPHEEKWKALRSQLKDFIDDVPAKELPKQAAQGSYELDDMPGMVRRTRPAGFASYSDYPSGSQNLKL